MLYIQLCQIYEELESTSKRLDKTKILAEFLSKLKDEEVNDIILLLQGKVFPLWNKSKLGISSNLVVQVLQKVTGHSKNEIQKLWKKHGDLGDVAKEICKNKSQQTLVSNDLTIQKVFENLQKIALIEGKGAVDNKLSLISELLSHASGVEAKYIIRTILEDLRVGTGEGVMRDSIVWSTFPRIKDINCGGLDYQDILKIERFNPDNDEDIQYIDSINITDYDLIVVENNGDNRNLYNYFVNLVQHAFNLQNDFAIVFSLSKEGIKKLKDISINLFHPLKCMLYQKADNIKDGFERVGRPAALEYKYDGFRLQIVKEGDKIVLFTRRFEEVTTQFPDVIEYVNKFVSGDNYILEAEAVGYDRNKKTYLPFQKISQRIRRKYNIKELSQKFPVKVMVFDCMYFNDENLINKSFKDRRNIIESVIKKNEHIIPSEIIITDNDEKANEYYQSALDSGNEGIMMKNLDAIYKPGSRVGFGVKVKPIMETLDLVIVGAEWGEGKRSGWLTSFTVACNKDDELLELGKVGTGIKEKDDELTFEEFTNRLKPLITKEDGKKVIVKPEIIIEIAYEEIQKSVNYNSNYALRFPRVIRFRDDKALDEISTLEMVEQFFNEQKKRK